MNRIWTLFAASWVRPGSPTSPSCSRASRPRASDWRTTMTKQILTKAQRENLERLERYLLSNPWLDAHFDMGTYFRPPEDENDWCGCLAHLGVCLIRGLNPAEGDARPWMTGSLFGAMPCSREYDWLFSGAWGEIGGHCDRIAAAGRIRALLESKIPERFRDTPYAYMSELRGNHE